MNFVLLLPEIYFFCSLLIFLTYTSILNLSPYYKFPNLFKNNLILLIFILLNVLFLVLNNLNIDSCTISNFFEKNTPQKRKTNFKRKLSAEISKLRNFSPSGDSYISEFDLFFPQLKKGLNIR